MKTVFGICGAIIGTTLPLLLLNFFVGGQADNYIAFSLIGAVMGGIVGVSIRLLFAGKKPGADLSLYPGEEATPVLGGAVTSAALVVGMLAVLAFFQHLPSLIDGGIGLVVFTICGTIGGVGYKLLSR